MSQREIARDLARLREELADLGDDATPASRRSEALENSIAQLRADLLAMREAAPQVPVPIVPRDLDNHPGEALDRPESG